MRHKNMTHDGLTGVSVPKADYHNEGKVDLNNEISSKNFNMPDVSSELKAETSSVIDFVGMESIDLPIYLNFRGSERVQVLAKVDALVNLSKPEAKGIHMSRLYLQLFEYFKHNDLNLSNLKLLLKEFISSQEGLSDKSLLSFNFQLPVLRNALKSKKQGWRSYPIKLSAVQSEKGVRWFVEYQVTYSSTCPCSAALARQLVQNKFKSDFSSKQSLDPLEIFDWLGKQSSIVATPHAQRSFANIKLELNPNICELSLLSLIDEVEKALKTSVQSAVKREDEQEFALINGQNLMFCEDSARKIKRAFDQLEIIDDYSIHIEHQESLHAHNATARIFKGKPGGFSYP